MFPLRVSTAKSSASMAAAMASKNAYARRMLAIREALGPAMRSLELKSPTDTNRFVNSWLIGAHQVGLQRFVGPVRPLQESKYIDEQRRAVERQVDGFKNRVVYWRRQVAVLSRMVAKHGGKAVLPTKSELGGGRRLQDRLREAEKKLAKAAENVERAQKEAAKLTRSKYAIVIGTFGQRKGRTIGTQVIDKVYGGTGVIRHTDESTSVSIVSHEPHTAILEKRLRLARDAKAGIRTAGIRSASKTLVKEMNAA